MSKCNCYLCRKHREFFKAKREKDFDTMCELADDFGHRLVDVEADLDYYKVIFDGSWPTAVEILERTLVKVKAIKAKDKNHDT